VNGWDPVPRVPAALMGYVHMSHELAFRPNSTNAISDADECRFEKSPVLSRTSTSFHPRPLCKSKTVVDKSFKAFRSFCRDNDLGKKVKGTCQLDVPEHFLASKGGYLARLYAENLLRHHTGSSKVNFDEQCFKHVPKGMAGFMLQMTKKMLQAK
jgi:hypothetical protein